MPLLEVDNSIIRNSLLLDETKQEKEEFDNLLKSFETNKESILVKPKAGVCVKTKTSSGDKVFINICHTDEIPPPEKISDDEFLRILDEDVPSWKIPMSVGLERTELVKQTKCLTYDIAINSKYFEEIQEKVHFLKFIILTGISAIEDKYKQILDGQDYIILKNKKFVGTIQSHRIQKREKKIPKSTLLIEEIPVKNTIKSVEESPDQSYIIFKEPKKSPVKLTGFFKIPNRSGLKDIKVEIGIDRIIVQVDGFDYFVDVFIPFSINQNECSAILDDNLKVLRLNMPLIPDKTV